ncbi:MAG: WD40 repeat domain-containing protein [Cyanobium sp.]
MATSLTPSQVARYGSRLLGERLHPGLPLGWQQRRAMAQLARDGSEAAVRAMAVAAARRMPMAEAIHENLLQALGTLTDPLQVQVIAEVAIEEDPEHGAAPLIELFKRTGVLPLRPPAARVAVALACGWPERLAEDWPEIVPPLLEVWSRHPRNSTATEALSQLRHPSTVDVLCRHWINARVVWNDTAEFLWTDESTDLSWCFAPSKPGAEWQASIPWLFAVPFGELLQGRLDAEARWNALGELLLRAGHTPSQSVERVLFAVLANHPELLAEDGPSILTPLLEIWGLEQTHEQAKQVLLGLRAPAAIDALCRHWIATGDAGDPLAALLLEAGHAPSEPTERVAFWLLIGQLERYAELDPEGCLLAKAWQTAHDLRQRLMAASVAAGLTQWLRAIQQSQPIEAFTADDWAATVKVLIRNGDSAEIWRWALLARPKDSLALLQALPLEAEPPAHLGEGARTLQALAQSLPVATGSKGWLAEHAIRSLRMKYGKEVQDISWSPDGSHLACALVDETIQLWDPTRGVCLRTLDGYTGTSASDSRTLTSSSRRTLTWSPDGSRLAGLVNKSICVWEASSGACLLTLEDPAIDHFRAVAWSPDGRQLASISNGPIRLWDAQSGACTPLPQSSHPTGDSLLAWSPDGRHIAASFTGEGIQVVDAINDEGTLLPGEMNHFVPAIAWSPQGRWLAVACKHTIRLWDQSTATFSQTMTGHTTPITGLEWSPDGRWLASCGDDLTLRLWSPPTGACLHTLEADSQWIRALIWSPNGRWLAHSSSTENVIQLWNPASGSLALKLTGQNKAVGSRLSWSPDGRCLATAGNNTIWLGRPDLQELAPLMETPLACFSSQHWRTLDACQKAPGLQEAETHQWVQFLSGLRALLNRFEVAVEETPQEPFDTPFAVGIDPASGPMGARKL